MRKASRLYQCTKGVGICDLMWSCKRFSYFMNRLTIFLIAYEDLSTSKFGWYSKAWEKKLLILHKKGGSLSPWSFASHDWQAIHCCMSCNQLQNTRGQDGNVSRILQVLNPEPHHTVLLMKCVQKSRIISILLSSQLQFQSFQLRVDYLLYFKMALREFKCLLGDEMKSLIIKETNSSLKWLWWSLNSSCTARRHHCFFWISTLAYFPQFTLYASFPFQFLYPSCTLQMQY